MDRDAVGWLAQDWRRVCALLDELIADSASGSRSVLLGRIDTMLDVHARVAHEVLYPALERAAGAAEAARPFHASAEHRAIERMVLPDLGHTEPGTPEFTGRARLLKDIVERHARQEEAGMLAQARTHLSAQQRAELGRRLDARRQELVAAAPEPTGRR